MLAVGLHLGPYELLAPLGEGGMGEVWRALDRRLGREVALKVLPEAFASDAGRLRRFQQEARTLAAMSHPNLVQVFEAGEWEGTPYLAMELLEGGTLRERMQGGPVPPRQAAEWAREVAHGLATAHEKGILHRDLKPENLLVTRDGRVKVLDFGLAKVQAPSADGRTEEAPLTTTLSEPGRVMGTPGYLSPEQVLGEPVDARSDLFSLGVVLWEMVAGERPFLGASAIEVMHAILKEEPPELPKRLKNVPALDGILHRCLAKAPGDRFQNASDLALALLAALDAPGSADWTEFPLAGRGARDWVARHARPMAVTTLLALGLAAGAAWHPWRKEAARPPTVVALPAKVLGAPESAFLTDAIPDTLSTLLAGVEGIDAKCPPSSVELERVKGDLTKVSEAYGVDLLLLTTVTVEGDNLFLNARLVEATTRKVRWASQFEGTRGTYNDLVRQAAVGVARAMRPPGAQPSVIAGPAFSSEIELAFREGRHLAKRYKSTLKEEDFTLALAALQRAQSLDPTSAILAAELGMLFGEKDFLRGDPQSHQQAKTWATRALELDPRCGLAWTVRCWNEATTAGRADPDRIAEYALKAVALSPGDVRSHTVLGLMSPTMGIQVATGLHGIDLDPLDDGGYNNAAYGLMDTGRAAEAIPILERALRLYPDHRLIKADLCRALFKLGRTEEALKVWAPHGAESAMIRDLLNRDPAAARERGLRQVAHWREHEAELTPWSWACMGCFNAQLLAQVGLKEEAVWVLQKAADSGGPVALDVAITAPDFQQLKGDPRYHQAVKVYRENALRFLKHAEVAEAQGNLPPYLKPPLAELRELVKRPI